MGNGLNRYTCRLFCHYRSGNPIDNFMLGIVRGRLAMPDLRELLAKPVDDSRMAALGTERKELRHRLVATQADYDNDLIDGVRYQAKIAKIQDRAEGGTGRRGEAARAVRAGFRARSRGPRGCLRRGRPRHPAARHRLARGRDTAPRPARITHLRRRQRLGKLAVVAVFAN